MQVSLNYGKKKLSVYLADDLEVSLISKRKMPVLQEPIIAIEQALKAPIGCVPLHQIARNAKSACILICDITRPVPNGLILPPLVRTLLNSGLNSDQIELIIATGLHRPNEGAELTEVVGDPWVTETIQVSNHFARDDDAHTYVGTTSQNTVVKLDRRFIQADLRIVIGLVEPHFMAGYSGGRKIVAPGIAHRDTITALHAARFMEHPMATNCILEGNPLHEEQLEIMEMIGEVLAFNTVIDEQRRLSYVNFGDVIQSHLQAVQYTREYAEVPIFERFSTIVTSAAGYPLDNTYYQTIKGMVSPIDILKTGGSLIIASACSEGMGSKEYIAAQKRFLSDGSDTFLSNLMKKDHAEIDEWQTEMQLKPMKHGTVYLYTDGLTDNERQLTGVQMIDSLENTIVECVTRSGDNRVAIIPEGPYVVPRYIPET